MGARTGSKIDDIREIQGDRAILSCRVLLQSGSSIAHVSTGHRIAKGGTRQANTRLGRYPPSRTIRPMLASQLPLHAHRSGFSSEFQYKSNPL
eukprot:1633512-Rhodomonas_salina.3